MTNIQLFGLTVILAVLWLSVWAWLVGRNVNTSTKTSFFFAMLWLLFPFILMVIFGGKS